jgi:VWFA-related protein
MNGWARIVRPALIVAILVFGRGSAAGQSDERVIYTSVVDANGAAVKDLGVKDFVVREDGVVREVLRIERDADPMKIALLIDNSAAMQDGRLSDLRRGVTAFIAGLRSGVQLALITLADRPTILVDYTTDRDRLLKAAAGIAAFAASGNYVLDGIYETSQALSSESPERPVIVAISSDGPELSHRRYDQVLAQLESGDAAFHVVVVKVPEGGQAIDRDLVFAKGTEATGGRYDELLTSTALEARMRQVADELSNQYRVVFARPAKLIPPETTEVSVRNTALRARGKLLSSPKER